jgi:hypothetical protein
VSFLVASEIILAHGFRGGLLLGGERWETCSPLQVEPDGCMAAVGVGVRLFSGSSISGPAVGVSTAVSYDDEDEEEALEAEKGLMCQGFCRLAMECVRAKP